MEQLSLDYSITLLFFAKILFVIFLIFMVTS